jgi:preprotein translocase subunit YajC
MLFASALAQTTTPAPAAAPGGFDIISIAPLVLIFVVFYFLLIRPQQKKAKEHKALVSNVRRGDRVVTQGGLIGVVTKVVNEGEVQIEISEGVRVRALRSSISDVMSKPSPADTAAADAGSAADKKNKGR